MLSEGEVVLIVAGDREPVLFQGHAHAVEVGLCALALLQAQPGELVLVPCGIVLAEVACARFPALQGGLHVHEAHKGNCAGLKDLEQIVRILGSHGRHFVLDDAHEFPSCALKTLLGLDDGHIVGEDHGLDVAQLCFTENDRLDITEYTQIAMLTAEIAMWKAVEERGLTPDVTAGLSLGEYCAIASAGGMTTEDAITTVRKRGILMQNAVPGGKGSMAAVLGMTGEAIEKVVDEIDGVTIANYNCPGQIVITGWKESVEKASEALKEAGAKRVLPLNVSGPFHSPMLTEAGKELGQVLENVELSPLQIPYVTNVTAEYVRDISETKELLAKQVASSVRWQQSVENMIADGVDTFVEIGPGRTLAGFMRKINRDVKVYNVGTWEDVDKVVSELC